VSRRADWSYVQARLHARHGERLDEVGWRMLDAAKSPDHFLERARATSLRRFTDRLDAQTSSHTIERLLRAEWRDYVADVAAWVVPSWQPAVHWVAYLVDLPVLDGIVREATPDWLRDDAIVAPFAEGGSHKLAATLAESALAPLSPAIEQHGSLAEQWLVHWRALWPRGRADERQWLEQLVAAVTEHVQRLARAAAGDSSRHYRDDLARQMVRLFRRRSGSPVALFAHLVLVALDLERLRGGLVRRQLFHANSLAEPLTRAA
jgi:hypothetical protein